MDDLKNEKIALLHADVIATRAVLAWLVENDTFTITHGELIDQATAEERAALNAWYDFTYAETKINL